MKEVVIGQACYRCLIGSGAERIREPQQGAPGEAAGALWSKNGRLAKVAEHHENCTTPR
jgi:hypothetical protein